MPHPHALEVHLLPANDTRAGACLRRLCLLSGLGTLADQVCLRLLQGFFVGVLGMCGDSLVNRGGPYFHLLEIMCGDNLVSISTFTCSNDVDDDNDDMDDADMHGDNDDMDDHMDDADILGALANFPKRRCPSILRKSFGERRECGGRARGGDRGRSVKES